MANLFIGIKGTVLAIDRATGETVWESPLELKHVGRPILANAAWFSKLRVF